MLGNLGVWVPVSGGKLAICFRQHFLVLTFEETSLWEGRRKRGARVRSEVKHSLTRVRPGGQFSRTHIKADEHESPEPRRWREGTPGAKWVTRIVRLMISEFK